MVLTGAGLRGKTMDNTQTKKEQESGNNAETKVAENTSAEETKPACGCCGGRKNKQ